MELCNSNQLRLSAHLPFGMLSDEFADRIANAYKLAYSKNSESMAKRFMEAEFRRSKGQKVSVRTINLFQDWKGASRDMLLLIS